MPIRTTLLTLLALVSFVAAYRFGSHGIRLHDGLCIGLACAAVTVGVLSLSWALRPRRHQRG
jgi:hypothetical protein